ncbi:MAG TPA: type II toxin-antitoxin system HicA family toxin [Candidatus Kapabacteria bacterium]|nr:type II toxin-antitoxin system HicA family toxin [Candidatus Kapabacteria bacterium]
MSKLYSSKEIISVLNLLGFFFFSQKGSHGKFKNSEGIITIVPMNKKEIPEGTLSSILKQVGLSKNEFKNKLEIK